MAQITHPSVRSLRQFRMITVFPGRFVRLQKSQELAPPNGLARGFDEKGAATSWAYDGIDLSHEILRQQNVRAFGFHWRNPCAYVGEANSVCLCSVSSMCALSCSDTFADEPHHRALDRVEELGQAREEVELRGMHLFVGFLEGEEL